MTNRLKTIGLVRFSVLTSTYYSERYPSLEALAEHLFSAERMELRFRLFEKLCLPALTGQTDTDFTLIVVTAEDMPTPYLERLNSLLAPHPNIILRPVGTGKLFTGQVWQVSPIISEQDRQGTARIALSYAPGLRPGGFATATIASGTVVAPILPESAVLSDEDGAYVLIINGEDKAERRAVTTGTVTSKGIVIAEGLNGSERVVLRAGGFLTEGETVRTQLAELDD